MILNNEQLRTLHTNISGGPLTTASIVIFGNELGTAETGDPESTVLKLIDDWDNHRPIGVLPQNSAFLQFIARFALSVHYKDAQFCGQMINIKPYIKDYISNHLYKTTTAIINLRPLPQMSENHWHYENIDKKDYYKHYNFCLLKPSHDTWSNLRVSVLKSGFESINPNALILGAGDKNNKRAFFKLIFLDIIFETIKLNEIEIYVCKSKRIILSNYFDYRSGIKLQGLQSIYYYAKEEKLI